MTSNLGENRPYSLPPADLPPVPAASSTLSSTLVEAPRGSFKARGFGCLGMIGIFFLVAFAHAVSPPLAGILVAGLVLSCLASLIGRYVPAAPERLRARAGRSGTAAVHAVAALLGFQMMAWGTAEAERNRGERLARLPTLVRQMDHHVEAGDWQQAAELHGQIAQLDSRHEGLDDAWARIGPEIEKIEAEAEAERRGNALDGTLARAGEVVGDEALCQTPKALAEVWRKLREVRSEDPQWDEARRLAHRLERCRLAIAEASSREAEEQRRQKRVEAARNLERDLLDKGFSVTVTVDGRGRDRMTIEYVLFSKAWVHKLTDGGSMGRGSFLHKMESMGFRGVTFTDGIRDSWDYALEPASDADAGARVLRGHGLGQPLELTGAFLQDS